MDSPSVLTLIHVREGGGTLHVHFECLTEEEGGYVSWTLHQSWLQFPREQKNAGYNQRVDLRCLAEEEEGWKSFVDSLFNSVANKRTDNSQRVCLGRLAKEEEKRCERLVDSLVLLRSLHLCSRHPPGCCLPPEAAAATWLGNDALKQHGDWKERKGIPGRAGDWSGDAVCTHKNKNDGYVLPWADRKS